MIDPVPRILRFFEGTFSRSVRQGNKPAAYGLFDEYAARGGGFAFRLVERQSLGLAETRRFMCCLGFLWLAASSYREPAARPSS
jgi:hypothetical protein